MSDTPSSNSNPSASSFLTRLKVGHRLSLSFATVLSISVIGAITGMVIGDRYEYQSRQALERTLAEREVVFNAKARTHRASIFQRDMVYLLNDPAALSQSIEKYRKATALVSSDFASLKSAYSDTTARSPEELEAYAKVEREYESVAQSYFRNVEVLLTKIETLDVAGSEADLATAQTLLLEAGTDPSFMGGHMFANTLQELATITDAETAKEVSALAATARLRRSIIFLSLMISIAIASVLVYVISRSIVRPLRVVGEVAQQVTQEGRFDLQAPITTQDEVASVASSLNKLIERVRSLLSEKELRAQELETSNTELVSTQKKMIAQEKLASLGSLTAGIAHEIKNPLNFVNNFAEIAVELVDDLTDDIEDQKEQLDAEFYEDTTEVLDSLKTLVGKIDHHGKRADGIVANMLQHSRSGESEWKEININELVKESINLAYHGMRAKQSDFNLEFDNDYDDSIEAIEASPQDLSRVFLNIASNACYAIYQRQLGEGDDFKPLLKVRTRQQDDQVTIYIRDNGQGMTPDVKAKVFDQFFTTKPTGEGTGLGLSLSYNIVVEQHKGTMNVESESGIYTDFIVTLPKSSAK